ncbi:MAG: hypothetical protein A2W31_06840 [Planctomycetes bacterium RBG_16_64_10]|nr:MAG: hypothetical protein A2W31_06840 [Planctomycetes bacterium RBG_16_64_10]
MSDEVWVAEEATLSLWEVNSLGVVTGAANYVLTAQDVRHKPVRHTMTKRQPGCAYEERRSKIIGHEISFGKLFSDVTVDITPLQDGTKLWRVYLAFSNPRNIQTDHRDFLCGTVVDGPDTVWQGNSGLVASNVTIIANRETA